MVVFDIEMIRDFVCFFDFGVYDDFKGKFVVIYCIGGICCEVLLSLMIVCGFGEVY